MKLSELKINKYAKVIRIDIPNNNIKRHLLEMGITRGVLVKLTKVAPMGDPLIIELRGYELCVRKDEARFILVEAVK